MNRLFYCFNAVLALSCFFRLMLILEKFYLKFFFKTSYIVCIGLLIEEVNFEKKRISHKVNAQQMKCYKNS